jgi:hypothetical protein
MFWMLNLHMVYITINSDIGCFIYCIISINFNTAKFHTSQHLRLLHNSKWQYNTGSILALFVLELAALVVTIEKQWFSCFVSWSPPNHGQNVAWIKPKSQRPSTQKPACFTTESSLIPIKTIPNLSWDVSRAFVMIEKQWFSCFVRWYLLNHGQNVAWIKPKSQRP